MIFTEFRKGINWKRRELKLGVSKYNLLHELNNVGCGKLMFRKQEILQFVTVFVKHMAIRLVYFGSNATFFEYIKIN